MNLIREIIIQIVDQDIGTDIYVGKSSFAFIPTIDDGVICGKYHEQYRVKDIKWIFMDDFPSVKAIIYVRKDYCR